MRVWTKYTTKQQEITVLLLPRFSNHCLANAIEPFRAANDFLGRDFYSWSYVTIDGKTVESSSGLPVLPVGRLTDHPGSELLFVVSSFDVVRYATAEMRRVLKAADTRFKLLAGLDTGSWLLADAGLLDGYSATIHPNELVAFEEQFESVSCVSDRVKFSGRRITCGGAMTSFDLALEMIRRTHGEALKLEVSTYFLGQHTAPHADLNYRNSPSALTRKCLNEMQSRVETVMTIPELAELLKVSPKTLHRSFMKDLGVSPMAVYRRIKLDVARHYVKTSQYSIFEIALRCGYKNSAAMTRAFVNEFQTTPSKMRRAVDIKIAAG